MSYIRRTPNRNQAQNTTNPFSPLGKLSIPPPVLIVEDNQVTAELLVERLKNDWQCEVILCETLQQAKNALLSMEEKYLLAITNIQLRDAPNGEIIDVLSAHQIPSIILANNFNNYSHEQFLSKGVFDYVLKSSANAIDYLSNTVGRYYKNLSTQILLVDDSQSTLASLKAKLECMGLQVETAIDGVDALFKLEANPKIQLIITDYDLPQIDGCELTLSIRHSHTKNELAVIGMSTPTAQNPHIAAMFLKAGANDYLQKPLTYEELYSRTTVTLEQLDIMRHLDFIAKYDFLTTAYNRRYFFSAGVTLHKKAIENDQVISTALIDIDHFRKINETYGHDIGDLALKQTARLIQDTFPDCLLARFGAEEFAVIFPDSNPQDIDKKMLQMQHEIATTPITDGEVAIKYTISVGLTHELNNDLDSMIVQSDKHLEQAKSSGQNQTCQHTNSPSGQLELTA